MSEQIINIPEITLDMDFAKIGIQEASVLFGFGSVLSELGLSESSLYDLIKTKMLIDADSSNIRYNKSVDDECDKKDSIVNKSNIL